MEATKVECEDEPVVLCGLPNLVKKFHEMSKYKVYYSKIGYLKGEKAEEIKKVAKVSREIRERDHVHS